MPRLRRPPSSKRTKLEARLKERFGVTGARGLQTRGLRYYDIARRLDIPASRLSEYVRGAYEIPWHHQIAICELLGCSPDDIVGDEP